jgi:hypothetical protein
VTEGGTRAEAFVSGGALKNDVKGKPFERLMHAVDWFPTLTEAAGLKVSSSTSLSHLPLDGVSQWDNLQGHDEKEVRDEIFYGYSTGFPQPRTGSAIRNSRWKLIRGEDTMQGPINIMPGSPWFCTPHCVNCSASKGYDFLDQECPKDITTDASRRLEGSTFSFFGKKAPKIQLYDLLWDPAETTDVSAEQPEVLKELTTRLDKWEKDTYLAPGEDPALTPGCPPQPAFPNHHGPNHVPIGYPWCDLAAIEPSRATLV